MSTKRINRWKLAPMSTPIAALWIPNFPFRNTIPSIIPKLYRTGEIAKEKKWRYVIKMFPRVLLIAKRKADGSINLVMYIMFICPSGSTDGNIAGIMLSMKINATTARNAINKLAPDIIVFAKANASFLFFSRYSEKIGMNAATNAPAMNRLNKMSGIKNDALYVSVAVVVPKCTAIVLSLKRPTA